MDANAAAAWAQFCAAVIGLGLAFYVPLRIHKNERAASDEDRKILAICVVHSIWPSILRLQHELDRVRVAADRILERAPGILSAQGFAEEVAPSLRLRPPFSLDVPPMELQYLGAPQAARVLQALSLLRAAHTVGETYLQFFAEWSTEDAHTELRIYRSNIQDVHGLFTRLVEDLLPIYRNGAAAHP